jgi:hypothetical protein
MRFLNHLTIVAQSLLTPQPARDWYLVLLLGICTGTALFGIALYLFLGIQIGFVIAPSAPPEESRTSVSRAGLEEALSQYQQRSTNFDAGYYASPDILDPSE